MNTDKIYKMHSYLGKNTEEFAISLEIDGMYYLVYNSWNKFNPSPPKYLGEDNSWVGRYSREGLVNERITKDEAEEMVFMDKL